MREIQGEAKTIREVLSGRKFGIDFYQREYRWQPKHIGELLDDLTGKFVDDHKPADERGAVESYGHYFLGSIILSRRENRNYVIDGQQRLTTLTLLLIHLNNEQDAVDLKDLIFSEKFGKKSFNLDVDERAAAMDALFAGGDYDAAGQPESVRNITERYHDIQKMFPAEIDTAALPYFADWLVENVHLVEITAFSDDDAYTIFETMNDRGLSLTPLDMLKGYVLANVVDEDTRIDANNRWKENVAPFLDLGKEEDSDAVKAWLRSQYAQSIRERKKNASPGDFDRLGTEFHRWIKEHDDEIGLTSSQGYVDFVDREMRFYTRQYLDVRRASIDLKPGLETVYFNARQGFTLQYPLLLSPLVPGEEPDVTRAKLRLVASYVDILIARRLWNFRSIAYSTMQYAMFLAIRDVRRKAIPELAEILHARLAEEPEVFATNPVFRLHQMNRYSIHLLLARMTAYVETESGFGSHFAEYVAEGKNRYEVEHIWADHAELHEDEFAHPTEFAEYRNRIGGLLLLPKSFNASYGDLPYKEKLEHYFGQNLLARSLHPRCYENNPGFMGFIARSGLPFEPHPEFKKADLDARQGLYVSLAEQIWSPDRLLEAAAVLVEESVRGDSTGSSTALS